MPVLGCEPLGERQPGYTSAYKSPQSPRSPVRQQFYHKYLDEPGKKPAGGRVRNMVFANKEERQQEKNVCEYITQNVLNQGKLTRITGITTMKDLKQQALAKRLDARRAAE